MSDDPTTQDLADQVPTDPDPEPPAKPELGPGDDVNSDRPAFLPDSGAADPDDHSPIVQALLHERQGYVDRDLDDRVEQVDAELERLGYTRVERATRSKPKAERATKAKKG
jgi:hypothetical protein